MERGTVSSRVALLLRSAEVKLLFYRFVQQKLNSSSSFFPYYALTLGPVQLDFGHLVTLRMEVRVDGFVTS